MKFFEILKNDKKFILLLFILSLIVRLAYVLPLALDKLSPDAYDWMNIGLNIATGHGWGDTWRPPGYAAWLGIIFFIFGKSILIGRIFNALLGSITCVIIFFIGKKIFSSTVGKIASFLVAFYPYFIAYTGDLLSETFLTFIISIAIFFVILVSETPALKNIIITGILIGLAGLTKSTVLPFFFLACGWLWWQTKSFRTGFMTGIFTLLTIAPWTIRNYLYFKEFLLISPGYGSLWVANNDEAMVLETMGEQNVPMSPDIEWAPKRFADYAKLPRMESEKIFKKEAIEWIENNPEKFNWLVQRRLVHFWRLYPMMAYKWQKYAAMATSGIYIPLCFIGIILSIKQFKKTSIFIALFIIYTIIHLPFTALIRYRVPIDPYIIIFASYTIAELCNKILWKQMS